MVLRYNSIVWKAMDISFLLVHQCLIWKIGNGVRSRIRMIPKLDGEKVINYLRI